MVPVAAMESNLVHAHRNASQTERVMTRRCGDGESLWRDHHRMIWDKLSPFAKAHGASCNVAVDRSRVMVANVNNWGVSTIAAQTTSARSIFNSHGRTSLVTAYPNEDPVTWMG